MDRGAWWATVRGVAKSGVTERLTLYQKELLPETAFLSERHICMALQTFAYQSLALRIILTGPFLFETPDPYCLLFSLRWDMCLNCQTRFESWWGFCKC